VTDLAFSFFSDWEKEGKGGMNNDDKSMFKTDKKLCVNGK
jgi:hypothetical protein